MVAVAPARTPADRTKRQVDVACVGFVSPIGTVRLVGTHTVTANSLADRGWATVISGGNDAIYGTYEASGTRIVQMTVEGGTGRFEGASGAIVARRQADNRGGIVLAVSGVLGALTPHQTTTEGPPPLENVTIAGVAKATRESREGDSHGRN